MAVGFDASNKNNVNSSVASVTVSLTAGGSANGLTGQITGYNLDGKITSVTWNGLALTLGVSALNTSLYHSYVYYWDPVARGVLPTGAQNLVVNFSPNAPFGLIAVASTFTGANQTTPKGNTASTIGAADDISTSISMTTGSMAVDIIYVDAAASAPLVATGGATSMVAEQQTAGGDSMFGSSYSLNATAMSWTYTSSRQRAHAVMELMAAGAGLTPLTFTGSDSLAGGELL